MRMRISVRMRVIYERCEKGWSSTLHFAPSYSRMAARSKLPSDDLAVQATNDDATSCKRCVHADRCAVSLT